MFNEKTIANKKILLEPYYPFQGFLVAIIEVDGAPVELIEAHLGEKKVGKHLIWILIFIPRRFY